MTDQSSAETSAGRSRRLREGAAATVEAAVGVVRLQPTLRNAVRRLRSASGGRLSSIGYIANTASDGITLIERGDVIDVQVEITARRGRSADVTALEVQKLLRSYVRNEHLTPGVVRVSVLDFDD